MKPRSILFFAAFFLAGLAGAIARADEPTNSVVVTPELIDQLASEAQTNYPGFQAAVWRAKADRIGIDTVRTWEDPTATLGGTVYDPRGQMASQEGDLIYALEEKLPVWGMPQLSRQIATAGAAKSDAEVAVRQQELRRDITEGLLEAALAEKVVELGGQDLVWLNATATAVENKYRTGQLTLADTLQIQNEVAERNNLLITDRRRLTNERLHLNEMLNRNLHSGWPALSLPAVAPALPFSQKLLSLLLTNEPQLKVLDQAVKQAESQAELVHRSRLPDVKVGAEARQYTGDSQFRQESFTVSFSLPWGNTGRYRRDYERAKSLQSAAEQDRNEQALSAQESLHHLTVEIEIARRQALLYDGEITVRSGQMLANRLSDWETGRGSLRDVLEARRTLVDSQLTAVRAVADEYQMLAEVALLTGTSNYTDLFSLANEPEIHHAEE